jgi:dGTPase
MPPAQAAQAREGGAQHRARTVADFIAGMTDRFALREHERLTGQRLLG